MKKTCEFYTKGVCCDSNPTQVIYYKKKEKIGEVCDVHAESLTRHRLMSAQPIQAVKESKAAQLAKALADKFRERGQYGT